MLMPIASKMGIKVPGIIESCGEHGVRAIVHLAALQVPFCKADPVAGAQANVVGTVNVLEAAREHGIRRVAYASSIAAHGVDASKGWLATLYGAYKHCNEQTARGARFTGWGRTRWTCGPWRGGWPRGESPCRETRLLLPAAP